MVRNPGIVSLGDIRSKDLFHPDAVGRPDGWAASTLRDQIGFLNACQVNRLEIFQLGEIGIPTYDENQCQ
jgi:hypothetical protein